jgi:hypothetical protein
VGVAQDSILRAVVTLDIAGQSKAQNVYHFIHQTATEQDDGDVVDAVQEFLEGAMDNFKSPCSEDVGIDDIAVYLREGGAWLPLGSVASSWAGTNTGDRVPAGVALMVELYKNRTGHADRKFLAGFTETNVSGDAWSSALLGNIASYVTDLYSPFTGTNGVEIRACSFNRETEATAFYTGGVGIAKVSYQRRRRPGAGLS